MDAYVYKRVLVYGCIRTCKYLKTDRHRDRHRSTARRTDRMHWWQATFVTSPLVMNLAEIDDISLKSSR